MNDAHPYAAAVEGLLRDTAPYLSCDECFDRIDQYVEARAADPDHHDLRMEVHLAGCGACAEEAATLLELLAEPS
ncbi:hypothetical protein [Nocardioides daejeonensis]|uniref:hypothetical protein n=1 Tax=Nocardioides daejeonensis TaxID=1046556 RepID=UPI000D74F4B3|nr:hypothetical protein [Nocardioides daejeonensis]